MKLDSLFTRLLLTQTVLALGFVALFVVFFYAERSTTVSRLVAERWAPALREAMALPVVAPAPHLQPLRRQDRPAGAFSAPALGPRLQALHGALRAQGLPLAHMAVSFEPQGPVMWLQMQPPGEAELWLGLPGEEMLPNVPTRLLWSFGLGALLLTAGSWWFTRRLTRPLQQLRQSIQAHRPESPGQAEPSLAAGSAPEIAAIDAAYRGLLQRLQRHEAERALLLAGASHDLRSPLARIRMAAELLPDELAVRREAIVRNTQLSDRLITSLLDQVRAAELPLDERLDLAELGQRLLAGDARAPGELSLEAPAHLPLQGVNQLLLERLLSNLIDNAFAHGRAPVRLRLRATPGGGVEIAVGDHGEGVPEAQRSQLLQAFARGDAARNRPGLGLGLAIVATVCERLGGAVHFTREDGLHWVVASLRPPT